MSDLPVPEEAPTPEAAKKKRGIRLWEVLVCIALIIAVDIASIASLGSNANETFGTIGSTGEKSTEQLKQTPEKMKK